MYTLKYIWYHTLLPLWLWYWKYLQYIHFRPKFRNLTLSLHLQEIKHSPLYIIAEQFYKWFLPLLLPSVRVSTVITGQPQIFNNNHWYLTRPLLQDISHCYKTLTTDILLATVTRHQSWISIIPTKRIQKIISFGVIVFK